MISFEESLEQVIKGATLIFIGTILGRAFSFIGQILVIRSLSPYVFGNIILAYTITSMMGTIMLVGSGRGVSRMLAASSSLQEEIDIIRSGYLIAILGGVTGSLLIYFGRIHISAALDNPEIDRMLIPFTLFVLAFPLGRVSIEILRGFKITKRAVIAKDLISRGLPLATLGLFLAAGVPEMGAIVYWVMFPIVMAIVGVALFQDQISITTLIQAPPSGSTLRSLVSFSWPLVFSTILLQLMTKVDVLMLGFFLQADQVGLYRSVVPLMGLTLFFLTSVVFLYQPIATEQFVEEQFDDLRLLYSSVTKWVAVATFPLTVTLILFSEDVIRIVLKEEYLGATLVLQILLISTFVRVISGPNGATVQTIDETKIEMVSSVFGFGTNIVLNTLLIPEMGIEGAAVATLGGFAVYNLIELTWIYLIMQISPFSWSLAKSLVPTAVLAVTVWAVIPDYKVGIITLLVFGLGMLCIQLLMVVITRSINDVEFEIINRKINKLKAVLNSE